MAQGDLRPMDGRDRARAELEELYARRAPLYAAAELTIDTGTRDVEQVASALQDALEA